MPTIVAISGQPTKNLGSTIVNAGNTPIAGDSTNNNAGFGVLTGSNAGKSSGSTPVPRVGTPVNSGIGFAAPGVQTAIFTDPFAGSPLGQVIGKTLTWRGQSIGQNPIAWNHIYSKYPRPSMDSNHGWNGWFCFTYCSHNNTFWKHCRSEGDLYGTSVSLTNGTQGLVIGAGAPSGVNSGSPQRSEYAYTKNRREGHVSVDEYNLDGALIGKGGLSSVGQINKEGFSVRGELGTSDDDWMGCGHENYYEKMLCSEVIPGFDRKGQRLRYATNPLGPYGQTDYPTRGTQDRRHTLTASGCGYGHAVTFNADGSRMAVTAPYADGERGEVVVYEYASSSGNGDWIRVGAPITGNGLPADRFGWDVSLDGDGDNVWVGAPRPGGTGYVAHFSLQGTFPGAATWKRDNHGGSVSGVEPRDKFGYSVTCNRLGNGVAVGAPSASGTRGTVTVYHRTGLGGATVPLWAPLKRGSTTQRIVGTASGERTGWSISMMYDSVPALNAGRYNPMIAVGSPFWSRSVAEYDWSNSDTTFAQKRDGVPIYRPWDEIDKSAGQGNTGDRDGNYRNGYYYNEYGLTCEGRVTVWQYSQVGASKKHHYTHLAFVPNGNSSYDRIMRGDNWQYEMGYSVAFSKGGEYLAVGCPGTDGNPDDGDCENLKNIGKNSWEGELDTTNHPPVECDDPNDPSPSGTRSLKSEWDGYGIGSVKTFRYIWEGAEGDAARKEHYLHSSQEDVWIKYGPTVYGNPSPVYDYDWVSEARTERYARPNFQDLQGLGRYPTFSNEERFGTDVSIIDVNIPIFAVGAPYAEDGQYNCHKYFEDLPDPWRGWHRPTGRVDIYSATSTRRRDNVMPLGAGGLRRPTTKISDRTKPKFEYGPDGRKLVKKGGGKESYFVAPKVSGSGLADDNALKTSRKTFGTGGINFTSSD